MCLELRNLIKGNPQICNKLKFPIYHHMTIVIEFLWFPLRIQAREPIKTKSAKVRNKRLQKKAHQFQKKASEDLKYALLHGSQGLRQHMLGSRGENTHWSGIQGSPTIKLIR
ncbi:uncharacterized protein LOC131857163 isoform X1 [Cryptomeria japonica]|uniref:uncharacterized protein LOC131857163 isoform X1 n=1 Tax=Cryptomeria japonica TaxID=3369 RepID=UPI0027DAAEE6|nr:uncharacterized protein LOC131857163 isoform X1 [Cryptomeria japonica]XP_059065314.1 uncharacterized protein LOC131857163 isoform X1 [Cryptomeria japonica]XP_059065315.1 uncharacterized protein LOC131857163 isoform X1 [Cryptomeria japonica]XP_059065316.1 uncharacterized protein LOC131857163 isoform X1 [Cryptomeria japonica]